MTHTHAKSDPREGSVLVAPALPHRSHLYRDFAVRPSKSPAATIWTSVGPAALKLDLRVRRPSFMRAKSSYLENYSSPGNPAVPSGSLPSGVQGHSS